MVSDDVVSRPPPHPRKLADGLFLRECSAVAELYPRIEFKSMIIDNCCMQVNHNENYDYTHVSIFSTSFFFQQSVYIEDRLKG